MRRAFATRRPATHAGLALVLLLGLTGCAPNPQLTLPVGEWVAVDDDHGTLVIRDDGTFTVTDASYNPIQDRDAADDFNAWGTWSVVRDGSEVKLNFKEAAQGDFDVQPGGFFLSFTSGAIRFHDPDEVLDIEFRLQNGTTEHH